MVSLATYDYRSPAVIAPCIGVVLSMTRSVVPVREVIAARKERTLGELNPGPFAAMTLNHTGWIVYAVLHTDWFKFVMEAFGLLCGIWLTLSLYPLASLKVQNRLNALVLMAATLYCSLALCTMILNTADLQHASVLLWNWAVSATQVLMCASPLSTIVKAVVQRSCASFHLGLIIMNCLSSTMWTIYGLTEHSLFISIPNALGIGLSVAALAVCIFFPRKYTQQSAASCAVFARICACNAAVACCAGR